MIRRYLTELKATVQWYAGLFKMVPRLLIDLFYVVFTMIGLLLLIVLVPIIPLVALVNICFDLSREAREYSQVREWRGEERRKWRAKDGE